VSVIDVNKLFSTGTGKKIYAEFLRAVKDFGFEERIRRGVLVGFSGGSDSVTLLLALKKFCDDNGFGKICAVHVNHMIRGAEAVRDEEFSKRFSENLGVEFLSFRRNVPEYARENSLGTEEAARNVRYSIFEDLLQSRNDISCIATAHNATDNLETVIFNMMRGAGTRGLSGISPVRDSVIRPLIFVPKRDILKALSDADIPYVTDSTNFETDYTRNYIRAEILPRLAHLSENPESQATRLSSALRDDADYLDREAERLFSEYKGKCIPRSFLLDLPSAIFYRFLTLMAKKYGTFLENTHVTSIRHLLSESRGDFSVSIPGKMSFVCSEGSCSISNSHFKAQISYSSTLNYGENYIDEIEALIILSESPIDDFSSKVYKIAIQQAIDFDIIDGDVFVREKRDGDSYCYGGMTHKLKKLFNDRKIPPSERCKIPVICDNLGILWVPGFGVRQGGQKNPKRKLYVAVAYKA